MSTSSPPPLTTLFVPPNSCFTDVYWYSFTSGQSPQPGGTEFMNGVHYLGLPGYSNCLPTNWAPSSYYSPGICPGGYTIACSSINSIETLTETVATCCPSDFSCLPQTVPLLLWRSTELCTTFWTSSSNINAIISVGGSTTLSDIPFGPGAGINAYSVQVRWQSTDSAILKLLTPTLSLSAVASSRVPPASAPSSASTASSTSSTITSLTSTPQPNLSTGAKIAIGVATSIVFLAIPLGLFIFWRRHRSKSPAGPIATYTDPASHEPWRKPELDAEGAVNKHGQGRSQFPTSAAELDAGMLKGPSELASSAPR